MTQDATVQRAEYIRGFSILWVDEHKAMVSKDGQTWYEVTPEYCNCDDFLKKSKCMHQDLAFSPTPKIPQETSVQPQRESLGIAKTPSTAPTFYATQLPPWWVPFALQGASTVSKTLARGCVGLARKLSRAA
jgi:hypothetical protein